MLKHLIYTLLLHPTEPTRAISLQIPLSEGADVLVHEATLCDSMRDQAISRGHSTPSMAAHFAQQVWAPVRQLLHALDDRNVWTAFGAHIALFHAPEETGS